MALTTNSYLPYAVKGGIVTGLQYYKKRPEFAEVYDDFAFLMDIEEWTEDDVKISGYVIDTLQAALWCLYSTGGFAECVLKAVNLGGDTDTTAAVVGALAGMWYGTRQILVDWQEATAKYEEIQKLSQRVYYACLNNSSVKWHEY